MLTLELAEGPWLRLTSEINPMTPNPPIPRGLKLLGGLALSALLLVGCIQSPFYPTPDSSDDPADQPDGGGSSASVSPPEVTFMA